mgnify:FL=1
MSSLDSMLAYLPFRVESGDFMAVMVGAVTLFVLYAVWSSFLVRDPMTRRVRQLFDHRDRKSVV